MQLENVSCHIDMQHKRSHPKHITNTSANTNSNPN